MKTILFQGDSITDAGRSRKDLESSGEGYALLVKAQLGYENPGKYTFHNRGVSGDRIVDVYARMKKNIIKQPNRWDYFHTEVKKRADRAKKVAEKYHLTFVPLQEMFDEAAKCAENAYWLKDGVHPTPMGHELIKREWLKAFSGIQVN